MQLLGDSLCFQPPGVVQQHLKQPTANAERNPSSSAYLSSDISSQTQSGFMESMKPLFTSVFRASWVKLHQAMKLRPERLLGGHMYREGLHHAASSCPTPSPATKAPHQRRL
jgi:hypothetical protein